MKHGTIFALGFFDGVHLGHQVLLHTCQRLAQAAGVRTAAITFEQHPQSLFTDHPPALINTTADRCHLLRHYGIETIYAYPVNEAVMHMPWEAFVQELWRYHGAAGFVCGDDFRFGHKGEGNVEKLRAFCAENGLECIVVPEQILDGIRISSTHIRKLIEDGDVETAVDFLGHPHILSGEVVPGQHLGRKLGFPTANIRIPDGVVCPKFGVYACIAAVEDRRYVAVANVGTRPTVSGTGVTVEPWLLDFAGDLYGKRITLEFHKFLRPEQKFASLEELRSQIQRDAAATYQLLR